MALIPDIAAHGLTFMHFFFHMEGGLAAVERFWSEREVPVDNWSGGLAYFEVPNLSAPHTVSLQWRRSGKDCADIRLAVDAVPADGLSYPKSKEFQIDEETFRDFFDLARQEGTSGILARYGVTLSGDWSPIDVSEKAKLKRFTLEAGKRPFTISVDFSRMANETWLVTIEPEQLLQFLDKPVDDEFFEAPLRNATILANPLLGASHERPDAT
jgi:hypothetical protein